MNDLTIGVFHVRKEIVEERVVNLPALRVVLHGQSERMIAQAHLLNDVVGRAPRFNFATVGQSVDGLMMRAVHHIETMRRAAIVAQRLDVVIFLLGQIMTLDIELERPAERDVENLEPFADGEDGQAARERVSRCLKFPGIPRKIDIFIEHGWVGHGLAEEFLRDIGTAGHEQAVHFAERDFFGVRVPNANVGILREDGLEPFFVLRSHPCRDVAHRGL
jgi:hypothetical protein